MMDIIPNCMEAEESQPKRRRLDQSSLYVDSMSLRRTRQSRNRKIRRRVHRDIIQQGNTKRVREVEEQEETDHEEICTEEVKISRKVDREVTNYSQKLNQFASKHGAITQTLGKWGKRFEDQVINDKQFGEWFLLSIPELVDLHQSNPENLDSEDLEELIKAKMFINGSKMQDLPQLLAIKRYSRWIEPKLKYFNCLFFLHGVKTLPMKKEVEIPEFLLRHFKDYHPVIDAFFEQVKRFKTTLIMNDMHVTDVLVDSNQDGSDAEDAETQAQREMIDLHNIFGYN